MKNVIFLILSLIIVSCSNSEQEIIIKDAWLASMEIDDKLKPHTFLYLGEEKGIIGSVGHTILKFKYEFKKPNYILNIPNQGTATLKEINSNESSMTILSPDKDTLFFKKITAVNLDKKTIKDRLNGNTFIMEGTTYPGEEMVYFYNDFAITVPKEFTKLPAHLNSLEIITFNKEQIEIVECEGFFFLLLEKYMDSRMLDMVGFVKKSEANNFEVMNYMNGVENEMNFTRIENDNTNINNKIIGEWRSDPNGINLLLNNDQSFVFTDKRGEMKGDWHIDDSGKILILSSNDAYFKIAAIGEERLGIEDDIMKSITTLIKK